MQLSVYFTPTTALVGGLVLGTAAVGKFLATGRILGISGTLKGFVTGNVTSWRLMFTGGMLAGALWAGKTAPDAAFDTLPASYTVDRAAAGGLMVGLGAALGNGCTSGHGICGNARLSIRSAVYTMIFMACGMAAATLTQSAAAVGIAPKAAAFVWPQSDTIKNGLMLVGSAVVTMGTLLGIGAQVGGRGPLDLAAEFASGVLFSLGLVYTGMVRPTKVIAFLSPTHPAWDLSLMFVMGGALLVALPGFQAILRAPKIDKPVMTESFQIPTKHSIDLKLALGGILFGVGWGVSGMCPGPAVVAAAAQPVPQVLAYVAAMMVGMFIEGKLSGALGRNGGKGDSAASVAAPAGPADRRTSLKTD